MISAKKIQKTDPEAALVTNWLLNDSYHQSVGITPKEIWDGEVYLISDEDGPVMATRFQKALRVAIQFNPATRLRSARVGAEVVEWFKEQAEKRECQEIIVRPGGKAVRFAERLGFNDFDGCKILGV